ncbi:hypothetical protein [Cohnella massiliensis]|uniref:hypothetical protein n=1 Tax=Cohnella massiliensis TaxID=1816691 RepID=UPI0009BC2699|nr:hypothetical protein [Cohnella massiliensis]
MIDESAHKRLNKHEERIQKLEDNTTKLLISSAENTAKLANIETGQVRLEKSFAEESRASRELLSKLIDSDVEMNRAKVKNEELAMNKRWDFALKVWAILGPVIAAIISAALSLK